MYQLHEQTDPIATIQISQFLPELDLTTANSLEGEGVASFAMKQNQTTVHGYVVITVTDPMILQGLTAGTLLTAAGQCIDPHYADWNPADIDQWSAVLTRSDNGQQITSPCSIMVIEPVSE